MISQEKFNELVKEYDGVVKERRSLLDEVEVLNAAGDRPLVVDSVEELDKYETSVKSYDELVEANRKGISEADARLREITQEIREEGVVPGVFVVVGDQAYAVQQGLDYLDVRDADTLKEDTASTPPDPTAVQRQKELDTRSTQTRRPPRQSPVEPTKAPEGESDNGKEVNQ